MKRILIVLTILPTIFLFSQDVCACQPSIIESGIRFEFEDCLNSNEYLVDLLFHKSDVDHNLYDRQISPYYFYNEDAIQDLLDSDATQIEYLDYEQDWISYLAYYDDAGVETFTECGMNFDSRERFVSITDEFKVVVLTKYGEVVVISDTVSTNITPDHSDDHIGTKIVFNDDDNTFHLEEYEAVYDINDCGSTAFWWFLDDLGYQLSRNIVSVIITITIIVGGVYFLRKYKTTI